jgi:hypothetical protein
MSYISVMTDFVKENYWVICEPVYNSMLVTCLINCHKVPLG